MKVRKKNEINKIDDETSIVIMYKRNGERFEALISNEDVDKVKDMSWHVGWRKYTQSYYAEFCEYLGIIDGKAKYKTIMMHRYLTDAIDGDYIDHINHNTLDNRRSNLRKTACDDNSKHRSGINSNNKSGYRNVSWLNSYNKWCVQLQINGKNTMLGKFDDVHEAGRFAEKMREKHYGKFKGNN